jgi:hypothetical protein
MRFFRHVVAAAAALSLLACGTVMISPSSGYLSDYSALDEAGDAASASRAATQRIDPAQVTISEVVWRVEARADIGSDERDALIAEFRRELEQRVQALPASPQGRPAQIRAAITRVETVSPALNTVGMLLLIGPLDRGGAAFEIEAVDPTSRRQLAALRLGYFALLASSGPASPDWRQPRWPHARPRPTLPSCWARPPEQPGPPTRSGPPGVCAAAIARAVWAARTRDFEVPVDFRLPEGRSHAALDC